MSEDSVFSFSVGRWKRGDGCLLADSPSRPRVHFITFLQEPGCEALQEAASHGRKQSRSPGGTSQLCLLLALDLPYEYSCCPESSSLRDGDASPQVSVFPHWSLSPFSSQLEWAAQGLLGPKCTELMRSRAQALVEENAGQMLRELACLPLVPWVPGVDLPGCISQQ